MNLLKTINSSIFQLISLLFVVLYLLGLLNTYFSDKNNYCVMTYMFEYPQFVRIALPENKQYPQYALYAYGEGRITEKARKMWFDGIPVLFLPGNSGSHMQGRSLASVALRKALSDIYDYHFDFFTVDFNEDMSGVYGGVLYSETEFTAACIEKILSLYKNNKYTKTIPTSVILIGHSMGGLIAKRLLAYPSTIDKTRIAITLAAPLEAPVLNTDIAMNSYYKQIDLEWDLYIRMNEEIKSKKMVLSFGNGPRDILMPSSLTFSNDSDINALTTAIPGVWVSPDHVSIVWCKQLVKTINRFMFAVINPNISQLVDNKKIWLDEAKKYFQANSSMTLDPGIVKPNVTMIADAFWYEDNRRIYQISRPEIDKTTYLMIRLVSFPQNRFVAIEAVNVDDRDWIFGCNAAYTYGVHRYCKQATSLTELSRWTGAATDFGKRKLATIHLHDITERHPDWSHVIVKVSPTRKPITLNVDVNDLASRQLTVDLPSVFSLAKTVIKETHPNSLYYELLLPGFELVHQAYLLYLEPTSGCKATQYHVSAEMHVPWAKNHEYFHYFTHAIHSPMKLRLFKSNPNATLGLDSTQHVKITLLLDPQCTYTVSISSSWYYRLAQFTRNYTLVLIPYVAAIVLLAVRVNIQNLQKHGSCITLHGSLMSEGVKPYYILVFSRLTIMLLGAVPLLSFLFENASWKNMELRYFARSLLVLPAYMTALGIVHVAGAAILFVMVSSSQLAHRLLFRIMFRGGTGLAERLAGGLRRVPLVAGATLVCMASLSCGAAALVAGAAFYAFMLSKMFEEYLEDYVYKLMAKVASKICRLFKSEKTRKQESQLTLVPKEQSEKTSNEKSDDVKDITESNKDKRIISSDKVVSNESNSENSDKKALVPSDINRVKDNSDKGRDKNRRKKSDAELDEDLSNLNFHTMMFLLWMVVTLVNLPALLTWARNFKFNMVLKPDTSYHTGMIMSICSCFIWQMEGPRKKLRHYESLAALLLTMAVFILALGPFTLSIVNYGVTLMLVLITVQQLFDKEEETEMTESETNTETPTDIGYSKCEEDSSNKNDSSDKTENSNASTNANKASTSDNIAESSDPCDVCSESRIYNVFKTLREKLSFNDEL